MTKAEFVEEVLRLGYAIRQHQIGLDETYLIVMEGYDEYEEVAGVSNTNVGKFSIEDEASFKLGTYIIRYAQTELEER